MGERQFAASVYVALKAETQIFTERAFGMQKVAAGFSRVGQQTISDYCNKATPDFMPIDVLADLMKASGDIGPLTLLADLVDHVVVPRPSVVRDGRPLGRITGAAMKETADVFLRYGQMLEDGVLSSVEGSHYLRKEIREAIEALVLMDMRVGDELEQGR